jgi:hypothetical protein
MTLSGVARKITPLPWWEGMKGRGNQTLLTPTLTLPRQGGGVYLWTSIIRGCESAMQIMEKVR